MLDELTAFLAKFPAQQVALCACLTVPFKANERVSYAYATALGIPLTDPQLTVTITVGNLMDNVTPAKPLSTILAEIGALLAQPE